MIMERIMSGAHSAAAHLGLIPCHTSSNDSLTRLYVNWPRVSRADNVEGYVRRILVNSHRTPDGWLTPDRMAVIQHTRGRLTLHASLDQGATWRHIPVSDEAAIPDALQQLG